MKKDNSYMADAGVPNLLRFAIEKDSVEIVRLLESEFDVKRNYFIERDRVMLICWGYWGLYNPRKDHNSVTQYLYNLKITT